MKRFEGLWERDGRNPAVGAVILVLGLGSLYFAAQIALQAGLVVADVVFGQPMTEARLDALYQPAILGVLTVTQYGLFFLAALAVIRVWHTRDLSSYLRLATVPWLGVALSVIGVIGLLPVVDWIARYLYDLVPELRDFAERTGFLVRADGPAELAAVIFVIAFTPAVCEELVFRAYLQRTLERTMPSPWHFLLSGVFFALFHQQVLTLPSLIVVGIYLSFMYYAFGSPYPAVAAHFVYNGVQVVFANLPAQEGAGFATPVVAAGGAIAALVVWVSARQRKWYFSRTR